MNYKVTIEVVPEEEAVESGSGEKIELTREQRLSYEKAVDEDISAFDQFFQRHMGNDPLVRPERSIIKTYLAYKLGVVKPKG